MQSSFRQFWMALLDIFFPPVCLFCNTPNADHCCPSCFDSLKLVSEPHCTCCGLPFSSGMNHLCQDCLQGKYHFDWARAAVEYQPQISRLIHAFKYQKDMSGIPLFIKLMNNILPEEILAACDTIIPVPLHKKRLQERGYNQSLLLANNLFKSRKELIDPFCLERHRYTEPQTTQSAASRRKKLRNAFQVTDRKKVLGQNILVIDDVFTTGATVDACARTLKKNGAKTVNVLTFARVILAKKI